MVSYYQVHLKHSSFSIHYCWRCRHFWFHFHQRTSTLQWRHLSVTVSQVTDNSTVRPTTFQANKNKENVRVSYCCPFVRGIHLWPEGSPYKGTVRLPHWPRQNGPHFADYIFRSTFLNENICSSLKISMRFVSKALNNNIAALVHIMAWLRPGDKPLCESLMVRLPRYINASLGLSELRGMHKGTAFICYDVTIDVEV